MKTLCNRSLSCKIHCGAAIYRLLYAHFVRLTSMLQARHCRNTVMTPPFFFFFSFSFTLLLAAFLCLATLDSDNEAFAFDVPIDRLSNFSLVVRVLDSGDRVSLPQTRTNGKAIVGPDAQTSIGLHHWNCMMTTPRKPIAQWHLLVKT